MTMDMYESLAIIYVLRNHEDTVLHPVEWSDSPFEHRGT